MGLGLGFGLGLGLELGFEAYISRGDFEFGMQHPYSLHESGEMKG